MPEDHVKARFAGKREESRGIATFSFLPETRIAFRAGQFAFFEFDFGGKPLKKHFTISSSPAREMIELTTIVSGSEYKQALDRIPKGHPARISRPMGSFTLDSRKSNRIAFLAGGIGITPARSMLQFLADSKQGKELQIVVFYSSQNEERIVFREELEETAKKLGNVQVVHTLTGLDKTRLEGWRGEKGFIDGKMVKRHLGSGEGWTFFVAGPPAFNNAMEKMLLGQLAIKKEMLLAEAFSGY